MAVRLAGIRLRVELERGAYAIAASFNLRGGRDRAVSFDRRADALH